MDLPDVRTFSAVADAEGGNPFNKTLITDFDFSVYEDFLTQLLSEIPLRDLEARLGEALDVAFKLEHDGTAIRDRGSLSCLLNDEQHEQTKSIFAVDGYNNTERVLYAFWLKMRVEDAG